MIRVRGVTTDITTMGSITIIESYKKEKGKIVYCLISAPVQFKAYHSIVFAFEIALKEQAELKKKI